MSHQNNNNSDDFTATRRNNSSTSVGTADSTSSLTNHNNNNNNEHHHHSNSTSTGLTQQNLSHIPSIKDKIHVASPIVTEVVPQQQHHHHHHQKGTGIGAYASDDGSGNSSGVDLMDADDVALTGGKVVGVNSTHQGTNPASPTGASLASNASEMNPYVAAGVLDPLTLPVDARRTVLILMFVLKTITSYDAGAFSIAIGASNGIESELDLDSAQSGFLGSAVYLGNVVGCALCAWLFNKYDAKYLLCIGMMGHSICTVLFALSTSYIFAVLARIGIGFTLSFVVVYSVVWADIFSPKANATLWLAVLNIGVPVGTLAGFVVGGFILNSAVYSWRWVFFIKSILMMPIVVFMSYIDAKLIDDPLSGTSKGRVSTPQLEVWTSFLTNKLMILNVAGLSVLYFVITGMQVFFTQYLRAPPFNASVSTIMVTFGATAVSAPIFGVVMGGWVMDKYGNYREHPDRAADLGTVSGTLAAVFGVFTTLSESLTTLSFNLWLMLFFGAAALPSAMGLIVAAVPPTQKNAASSFANIMFNIWGYFAGPMFCGFVAQYTGSLSVAMTFTLNMGWLGVVFFWGSSRVAKALVASQKEQLEQQQVASSGDNNNNSSPKFGGDGSKSDFGSPSITYPQTPVFDRENDNNDSAGGGTMAIEMKNAK